ncbi:acetyl-CoA synthetase-like protein [Gloeophyllum trabeum ATCC 11539]|uniref:Acetyl-CoA synthetase-like protein n=1 Tax=Gloeophyllum trabeum (strain ATCC 11539 / FP-39264 / Madison 617) TaxID=670483 RepID=S7PTK8_GLOTA|nr:acetyl-CoA synthetase-like protein [Gloeophyllum trabeum ATCC 11539]EPQ50657.1 acetyl-CoA synthetase-like protein [Gloeophyllum trabeum ATCC 11539]
MSFVPWPEKLDYTRQAEEVPGTKRAGQTAHYRNAIWGLVGHTPDSIQTLPQVFDIGLAKSRHEPFLGHRPLLSSPSTDTPVHAGYYVWQTYAEVDQRRKAIGSAVCKLFERGGWEGVRDGGREMQTVGIWSANRPEWQIVDFALHAYGKVGVSLYDTLGKDSVEYIITHAAIPLLFASSSHISALLKLAHQGLIPCLKTIVCLDSLQSEEGHVLREWAGDVGVGLLDLGQLEEEGQREVREPMRVSKHDVACICYTSGTTSTPKGVILTHGNLTSVTQTNLYGNTFPGGKGRLLSYLPLAHIYERICQHFVVVSGGSIGFSTNNPLALLADLQLFKPNFFPTVPRVLNRIYQASIAGAGDGVRGRVFREAVRRKVGVLRETGGSGWGVWDVVVFRKIQAMLGGRVALITCGSAPIAPEVMEFVRVALSCDVIEGAYGMTENCGTCLRVLPNDPHSSGTVGGPQPCNEVKLIDVPAMGYHAEDRRGEICVRGENCFGRYLKDDKNTRETVDAEGWVHTGDVGEMDACGRIRIIDRVKNIMKLAQGEYVALEKIENLYSASPLAAQLFVHGDALQSYLVGVVVPEPVHLASIASRILGAQVKAEDAKALAGAAQDEKVRAAILGELDKEAGKNVLKGFERLKRIHVSLDPFTVENGCLTPTLKIRRKDAYNKHKVELDALYALGEPTSSQAAAKL